MTFQTSPEFSLVGKTALITGASGGLGRHFALAGATVAVTARREDKLHELVSEIESTGGHALALPLDIAARSSFEACFDRIEAKFGSVDILINNVGITGGSGFWHEVSKEHWNRVMDTNLHGVWDMCQLRCLRLQDKNRPGVIVNSSSIYGVREGIYKLPYDISKAAAIQLTKILAAELCHAELPIKVNALCPGCFDELNGALLLLTSGAGSFINGTSMVVDGGHCVKPI